MSSKTYRHTELQPSVRLQAPLSRDPSKLRVELLTGESPAYVRQRAALCAHMLETSIPTISVVYDRIHTPPSVLWVLAHPGLLIEPVLPQINEIVSSHLSTPLTRQQQPAPFSTAA